VIEFVERAMSIDENNAECHRIMCRIALLNGRFAKSEHHLECALALNPNDPRLVVQRGINLTFFGDPETAIPWIERAMRLDPLSGHRYYLDMVRALFMAGRPTEATIVLERAARTHLYEGLPCQELFSRSTFLRSLRFQRLARSAALR
jgi:tetratricopeptide (TPR) repeat protein